MDLLEFEINGIQLAPIFKRTVAFVIDNLLLGFLLSFILNDQMQELLKSGQNLEEMVATLQQSALFFVLALGLWVLYEIFFVVRFGGTIGKVIMKIKIIDTQSLASPTISKAVRRTLLKVVCFTSILLLFAFLVLVFNSKRQALHDIFARTAVVEDT